METPELFDRFKEADSTDDRQEVLRWEDLEWSLPPEDVIHYYRVDPDAIRRWIEGQIKRRAQWGEVPDTYGFREDLRDVDPEYATELFRRTCRADEWEERVGELSKTYEGEELVDHLERIHPNAHTGLPGAVIFLNLLQEHGPEVGSYVRNHASKPWSTDGSMALLEHLAERENWSLWDEVVCGQPSTDLDKYVRKVLAQADERPGWARERLMGMEGASYIRWRERETARLGDEVARDVYRRFPNVLKSSLDEHVHIGRLNARHHGYKQLASELQRAGDEAYYDRLAAKFLSQALYVWGTTNHYESVFEHFVEYYEAIDDDTTFVERATRVLAGFQPNDEENWFTLRKNNPLTRVFFEQTERFRARPELVVDLLESSFFTVRSLGFRALEELGDAAGELAADHPQLILAAPLDRLTSRGMRSALAAMRTMVSHEPTLGSVTLSRLREAASMAYPSFSTGELVKTMGHILRQSPELRRASEQPVIYESKQGGDWA
jgi:hypothetical protein